jgi:hypothetical protein
MARAELLDGSDGKALRDTSDSLRLSFLARSESLGAVRRRELYAGAERICRRSKVTRAISELRFDAFRAYRARTSQTTRQIITMVPTSPYPNIVASSKPKIVGFRYPTSHNAPTLAGCMSHLAHNPSNWWRDRGCFLRIAKWQAADGPELPWSKSTTTKPDDRIARNHYCCNGVCHELAMVRERQFQTIAAQPVAAPKC